jgi:hypothetical protein
MKTFYEKNKNIMSLLLMICVYFVGIYLVTLRMMHFDLTAIPGDLADARLNNYFLEHGYKWITGQVSSFWNAPFFYPATQVMAFSDNHLGTLPIYSFFRFLHLDRETSYQLWFLAVFTLNYFCCAWVLRKMSINALGATVGAYVFTFSLPVIAQMGHSQLLPRFMIPFAFYFAWQYLEKRDTKTLALACLAVVIQFYCTIYMGIFLTLGLMALLIAFNLIQDSRPTLREMVGQDYRTIALRTIIVILSIISLLPLIIPYYGTSLEFGMRSWEEIAMMLPRIRSYFYPLGGSLLWNWLSDIGRTLPMAHEHQIFIGAVPLLTFALMPVFYFRYRNDHLVKKGMIAFITTTLLILLTLYVRGDFSLYKFALFLPGLKAIRAVTRIMLMMLFPFAVILGIFFHSISENKRLQSHPFVKIIFSFSILFALVLDQNVNAGFFTYSKLESQNRLTNIEQLVNQKDPETRVFAYMPDKSTDPPDVVHLDAMLAAQSLNMATVNGHSGFSPMHYADFYYNYDQCSSLLKWKAISVNKYGKYYEDNEIFKNFQIVGRDTCLDDSNRSYTLMETALPEDGFNAKITCAYSHVTTSRDKTFKLTVQVQNNSSETWRCLSSDHSGKYKISVSYRWLSSDHSPLGTFDNRMSLPHDLRPGASTSLDLAIHSPSIPGKYFLEFDLVQELVSWFRDRGSSTALVQVIVL